jgi:hypothetical protein
MVNKLAIFLAAIVVLVPASSAWSQNPVTTDAPFQVRYMANLNIGDSFVNITNSGASGGNICTNVYVYNPAEVLVACCACTVTPNELVRLSARNSLISNTLTDVVPPSIVVKLVATNGSCANGSAATEGTLAVGQLAWGTTIHPLTTTTTTTVPSSNPSCKSLCNPPPSYWAVWCQQNCSPVTTSTTTSTYSEIETQFAPATLSAAEYSRLTVQCGDIGTVGGGAGICAGCQQGGE